MWRIALVVGLALAGCFSANEKTCDDGTVCPGDKVCAPAGGACVDQDQIDACQGVADGGACQLATIGHGLCHGGLCVAVGGCGDCVVEDGEVCDDCNTTSGDGCRADCQKIEMCGDGFVDEGEACDDGNDDPSDGCDLCRATEWLATPIIAGNAQPLQTALSEPSDIAIDRNGNVFIADRGHYRVLRLDRASGTIVTVAGNGSPGYGGDGGPATAAPLDDIFGLAVDGLGNLYIALETTHRVRRVDASTGIITTIAGDGVMDGPQQAGSGNGGLATAAAIRADDVAVDGLGNIYIAETQGQIVRRVDPATGIITTYAGVPTAFGGQGSGDLGEGVDATTAKLTNPSSLATDSANNLYIGENSQVRKVDATTGKIYTVAGTGMAGDSGDGGPATAAQLNGTVRIAVDTADNLFIVEPFSNVVRRVTPDGIITTVAGNGGYGDTGDGGDARSAQIGDPYSAAVDPLGNLWIVQDASSVVREVQLSNNVISRQVGTTMPQVSAGELTSTVINTPQGLAIDAQGRPYVGYGDLVVRVDASALVPVTDVADAPGGLAFDTAGNLYISETIANRIDMVTPAGTLTTIAGTGSYGYNGDGGPATDAQINGPTAIAVNAAGDVYFVDNNNGVIRKISNGIITTIAGTGAYATSPDGTPATAAALKGPRGVALDAAGNVYIAEADNDRVREIDSNGNLITVAGNGATGDAGDGGQATAASITTPGDVFFDASGRMYILGPGTIRRVDTDGVITTIAGGGGGPSGDMGPALGAGILQPWRGAVDAQGNIYVTEGYLDGRVRKITASGRISTLVGAVEPVGMGPIANAQPVDPGALALTPAGTLIAGGASGIVQALSATRLEAVIGRYMQTVPTGNLAKYRSQDSPAIGGIAFDSASNVVYVSIGNEIDAVTMVDTTNPDTWTIATIAGDDTNPGYDAGNGTTQAALFRSPSGLAFDPTGPALYVADTGNNVVRAVNLQNGTAPTVAGTPRTLGYGGDGIDAKLALLNGPTAVTRCGPSLFIADTANNRVRRVDAAGIITTVIGDGVPGSSGMGSPASQFPVDQPRGLACDAAGNLFVTSTNSVRLLAADANGVVDGMGSVQTIYGAPPRDMFPEPVTRCLSGIVVVDDKTVRISDSCTGMLIDLVRQVKQ